MMNSGSLPPNISSDTLGAMALLAAAADPVASQKLLSEFAARESAARLAEADAVKKITACGDVESEAARLATWDAELTQRENVLADKIRRLEQKRDALAKIAEWAEREHQAVLDDDRLEKLAARLAQTAIMQAQA